MEDWKAKALIWKFARKQKDGFFPCPRCGKMEMSSNVTRNAVSRRCNCYICDVCGIDEALEDQLGERMPLSKWAVILNPSAYKM